MSQYAELVRRGQPDFIEVKGVTFCGSSDASTLTMKNVPFHHEVCLGMAMAMAMAMAIMGLERSGRGR